MVSDSCVVAVYNGYTLMCMLIFSIKRFFLCVYFYLVAFISAPVFPSRFCMYIGAISNRIIFVVIAVYIVWLKKLCNNIVQGVSLCLLRDLGGERGLHSRTFRA